MVNAALTLLILQFLYGAAKAFRLGPQREKSHAPRPVNEKSRIGQLGVFAMD
jgi:hypothetical protein